MLKLNIQELMICIPPYELAAGVYGAFEVHSGIYYNLLTDQISTSGMDGKTIFPVEFLGKKLKEAKDYYGKRYYVDGFEGSSYVEFASSPCFFAQTSESQIGYDQYERGMNEDVNWNSVIKAILVYEDDIVLDRLTGSMTYPEIVKAVGKEVVLEEPHYWYSELDSEWKYTLDFDYKGYYFYYEWGEDPDTTKSVSVWIS